MAGEGQTDAGGRKPEGRRIPAGSSVQTHALQKPRNFLGGECPLTRPHLLRGLTWALMARLATPRSRLEAPPHCRPLGRLGQVLGSSRPQGAAQAASWHLRAGRDPWGQGRKPEPPPPHPALQTRLPWPGAELYLLQNLQLCRPHFHGEFGSLWGFPGGAAGKESTCSAEDLRFPWVGKIPWRKERLPTPGFWPGEFHGL